MAARAMIYSPENPAKFLQDHPLEFQNAGKVDGANNFYKQAITNRKIDANTEVGVVVPSGS